ncbi:hypothetical protein, partial [Pseudomonas sp. MWU12-2323]|uniref:hypothetical protein n=1 Tax=Pseudomonas sp. MWU12-2323 TaxID=2651296 RepID=UPI001C49C446
SREIMQRFFTWVITFFSGIRSIVLIVFGIVFLVCAGMGLYDATTLWQECKRGQCKRGRIYF